MTVTKKRILTDSQAQAIGKAAMRVVFESAQDSPTAKAIGLAIDRLIDAFENSGTDTSAEVTR